MKIDQTVERVHKIRREISEKCDHDTRKLVEYYIKYQEKYKDRLIGEPEFEKHYIEQEN